MTGTPSPTDTQLQRVRRLRRNAQRRSPLELYERRVLNAERKAQDLGRELATATLRLREQSCASRPRSSGPTPVPVRGSRRNSSSTSTASDDGEPSPSHDPSRPSGLPCDRSPNPGRPAIHPDALKAEALEAYWEGESPTEIAHRLEVPPPTVRSWVHRERKCQEAAERDGAAQARAGLPADRLCHCGGFALPDEDGDFHCLRCARPTNEKIGRVNGFDALDRLMRRNRGALWLTGDQSVAIGKGAKGVSV